MRTTRNIALKSCALVAAMGLLGACALPRSGPDIGEITAGSKASGGDMNIVMVDYQIARASILADDIGFSSAFLNARASDADIIYPGDLLAITVWENVDNGLLASVGQKVTALQQMQVDQAGRIFVPYAGTLIATGQTPEQLRQMITRSLDTQTPDPQVEVRRVAGEGSSVSIMGGVGVQGVFPIEPTTRTLGSMLAKAGGVSVDADVAQIAVRRGNHVGRIFLQDLFDDPRNDIALRSNDVIIIEEDRRTFTAMGSASAQAQVPFPSGELDLIQALAVVGGLSERSADPKGIFIFRREPLAVARRVLGGAEMRDNEPFAYVVDLTQPSGIFIAKEFKVRDGDIIYVTEAPFTAWTKVLEAVSGTLNFGATFVNVANAFDGN